MDDSELAVEDMPYDTPLLTASLPGTGGVIKQEVSDFKVSELLAEEPEGTGDHLWFFVEKRDLDSETMRQRLAAALEVPPNDLGVAGLKDKRAITRQWVSAPVACEARLEAMGNSDPQITVLSCTRHVRKLHPGGLSGNRFDILIRGVVADAYARASAILAQIKETGLPNYFGPQRFGDHGQTAKDGFAILRGEPNVSRGAQGSAGFLKRLRVSAAQSALFNTYLKARQADGLLRKPIMGDVMLDPRTLLPFWVTDLALAEDRIAAGKAVAQGPIYGPRMRPARGVAAEREQAVLLAAGLTLPDFERVGRLALGTRRAILVPLKDLDLAAEPEGLRLQFVLPAGSYATVLLAEVMKG